MTHEDRQGGRVSRLLVPAGIAAALVAGAVAYAGPASATTPPAPTLTLTMPDKVSNNGAPENASLVIDNSATGSVAVPGVGQTLDLNMTPPAGIACGDIALTAAPTASDPDVIAFGAPSSSGGVCTWPITAVAPASAKSTFLFTVAVTSTAPTPVTGSITQEQVDLATTGTPTTHTLSNVQTTQIVNPSGPTLAAVPPAAIVHQDYSYQLVTDFGFPTKATLTVYLQTTNPDGSKTCTAQPQSTLPDGDKGVVLNDGLALDVKTGAIAATAPTLNGTDSTPPTYVVVANNGFGGASAADSTTCPATAKNDVRTAAFTIPVLFGDTAVNSLFGPAIYKLADNGIISGYGDGDFHGQFAVTRDQFAHYIAKYAHLKYIVTNPDGTCSPSDPSAFTDVPNSSIFCQDIKFLASKGIVNGYGNGTFKPAGTILRQEMAAFIYRAHEVLFLNFEPSNVVDAPCTSPTPFTDVTTSNLFCGDIEWLNTNKITQGYGDGTFRPKNGVARQEAAQFIYKLGVLENHTY